MAVSHTFRRPSCDEGISDGWNKSLSSSSSNFQVINVWVMWDEYRTTSNISQGEERGGRGDAGALVHGPTWAHCQPSLNPRHGTPLHTTPWAHYLSRATETNH